MTEQVASERPRRIPFYVRFSMNRPVTVLLCVLTLVVLGSVALTKIPLQFLPSGLSSNHMHVYLPLQYVTPAQVERDLVPELEDILRNLPHLVRLETTVASNGVRAGLVFGATANVTELAAEVRTRMERVRHLFPPGTERFFLWHFNPDLDLPVVLFSVSFPPEVQDIWYRLEEVLRPHLEALPSVGRVSMWGFLPRHVAILLDRQKTRGARVDLFDLVTALSQDNQNFGIGSIRVASRDVTARVLGAYTSLEDFRRFPVRPDCALEKIAAVGWDRRSEDYKPSYLDGNRSVVVAVLKSTGANTVEACREVVSHIERLFADDARFAALNQNVFFNQGKEIERSVGKLGQTGLWGAAFATLVLFLFLRHRSLTIIVIVAIPLSLLFAILLLFFGGGTLNAFSMAGMTIAIGMLVDNAIVVLERIFRLRQEGSEKREAARRGTAEVALAIATATFTTMAAFLPIIFMAKEREARVATRELGYPVCYALAGSLLVALVVVPLATCVLAGRVRRRVLTPSIAGRLYTTALAAVLKHRFHAVLTFAVLMSLIPILVTVVRLEASGDDFHDAPSINVEFPGSTSRQYAQEVFDRLYATYGEAWRRQYGIEHIFHRFDRSGGVIRFFAEEGSSYTKQDLEKAIGDRVPEVAGAEITVGALRFGKEDLGTRDVRVTVSGPRSELVRAEAERIREYLAARLPGVEVRADYKTPEEEFTVGVRRGLATHKGVDASRVSAMVSWALRGARIRDFSTPYAEIPVWVHFQKVDQDVESLAALDIPMASGNRVPLTAFTTLATGPSAHVVRRVNGRAMAILLFRAPQEMAPAVEEQIRTAAGAFTVPPGFQIEVGSGREAAREAQSDIWSAMILSVVLVFLLMGILFESFILPAAVLFSIPSAFLGSLLLLLVLGYPLNIMGCVGGLVLVGIVVNNAIVLMDAIGRLRHTGLNRTEACLRGGQARLRPIWMTALSTVFGLAPMLFADPRSGGASWRTLSLVIAGGLLASTFFTLLAVPLFYTLLDDLSSALGRAWRWALHGGKSLHENNVM